MASISRCKGKKGREREKKKKKRQTKQRNDKEEAKNNKEYIQISGKDEKEVGERVCEV